MVAFTEPASMVSALAQAEARRLGHRYLGPEHLLLGLLVHGANRAAAILAANGLDLATTRHGVVRLVAQGVLPGPRPDDPDLLASLGVDLAAVHERVRESFGDQAYWDAAQRVRLRPNGGGSHQPPGSPPRNLCRRALLFAADEAVQRDQEISPEHLLLGLLRDARDPTGAATSPLEGRQRALLGLPEGGPHPVAALIEASGLSLDHLRAAVLDELDRVP
jgi:ATP-dependent Clp protease ATP-binding subunit ClpA